METIDLAQYLPLPLVEALGAIGAFAAEREMTSYIVGGAVRDLLLRDSHYDIDLMVEGDGTVLAEELYRQWSSLFPTYPPPKKPVCYPRYRTAKLVFSEGDFLGQGELDFASARSELYLESGKPPEVSPSDRKGDLARRDFTVNAMAISIAPQQFGAFFDPFKGRADLDAKTLRLLHPKSFADDPVRMIRGVRFAERFGFAFEERTEANFQEALQGGYLLRVPQPRRFDEFRKSVEDPAARGVLEQLLRLGLLEQIFPSVPVERLALGVARFAPGPMALANTVREFLGHEKEEELRRGAKALGASGARLETIVQRGGKKHGGEKHG